MIKAKYKMVRAGFMPIQRGGTKYFYRIQAVRDIPEHDVKAGDFGGYVTGKHILSQEDSCWIGGSAQVIGAVTVEDNAYIGDNAYVHAVSASFKTRYSTIAISENVRITEKAVVISELKSHESPDDYKMIIHGNAQIYGNAHIDTILEIEGNTKIYGEARVNRTDWIKDAEIYDNATIGENCVVVTDSKISGKARLQKGVKVYGSLISGDAVILEGRIVSYGELDEGKLEIAKSYVKAFDDEDEDEVEDEFDSEVENPKEESLILNGGQSLWNDYQGIVADIDSYRTDIVKIIKYPVMTDRTDQYTLKMMMALKKVQRLEISSDISEFRSAVVALEEAFMMAESNAEKIASSLLSDEEKKKTEKAKDLFRIASNEASSDHEKKVAFVQGFKQLEGIIAVPEVAVDTFRVKIGLKELES